MTKPFSSDEITRRRAKQRYVRKTILGFLETQIMALPDYDPDVSYVEMIFVDPRDNGHLQLTDLGYDLLQDNYARWSIQLEQDTLTIWQHTYMSAASQFPYHFDCDSMILTTFDAALGVAMKLVNSTDFADIERVHPIIRSEDDKKD